MRDPFDWRCSNELSSTNLTVCGCGSITGSFEVRWQRAASMLAAVRTLRCKTLPARADVWRDGTPIYKSRNGKIMAEKP